MDMQKFQALGLSTEAPATEEVVKRLVRTYPMFVEPLTEGIHLGGFLDSIKKYVFYRKMDPTVENQMPPVWPTGEKKERIQQLARMLHGLIGVGTEFPELAEEIIDFIEGTKPELDLDHIKEECFDLMWYINIILHCCGTDIPTVCEQGIAKLKARYPDKFTEHSAEHRDTAKEMHAFNSNSSMARDPS